MVLLAPETLEQKRLEFQGLSFFKKYITLYHIQREQRRLGAFYAYQNGMSVWFSDEKLRKNLEENFKKGRGLPSFYLLDDLFFQALQRIHGQGSSWVFILRQENHRYALAVYHKNHFIFKRTFLETAHLKKELEASKTYLKRFGYQDTPITVFFFSNDAVAFEASALMTMKRVPYDLNEVIQNGLKSKQKIVFKPPLTPNLSKASFLKFFKKTTLYLLLPLLIIFLSLSLFVEVMYDKKHLDPLQHSLARAMDIPKEAAVFQAIEKNHDVPFEDDFWKSFAEFVRKEKLFPKAMDVNYKDASARFYFHEDLSFFLATHLKKLFPHYKITLSAQTISFEKSAKKEKTS